MSLVADYGSDSNPESDNDDVNRKSSDRTLLPISTSSLAKISSLLPAPKSEKNKALEYIAAKRKKLLTVPEISVRNVEINLYKFISCVFVYLHL